MTTIKLQRKKLLVAGCFALANVFCFSQTNYTFTSCGVTGPNGPSQAQVNAAYLATNLNGSVVSTGGIQTFTIPTTSLYRITAYGASGGGTNSGFGSRGRIVQGEINLVAGTVIKVLVGQQGQKVNGSSGGGGGSFVSTNANVPILVAGGGGGHYVPLTSAIATSDGSFGNSGQNSACASGTGGSAGTGGTGSNNGWGGGGGGFSGNGTNAINCIPTGGQAFVNGGAGGATCNNTFGGFGGGGGTHGNTGGGGGGGGYSGGGGSNQNLGNNAGGGGGSYTAPGMTNVLNLGLSFGDGTVVITQLCNVAPVPTNTTAAANQSLCSNFSTTLGVSGTGTINWFSSPSSTVLLNVGSSYATPTLAAGNYTFYASASNTCGSSARTPITVTVNFTPSITVNSGTLCSGNSFTINPTGGVSYVISGGTTVVTPSITSAYTVTGTGVSGCTNTAISSVVVYTSPTITVNSGAICVGQNFTMIPSGATTYTYQGGSAIVSPILNTNYTVTGTSALGCVSQSFATASVTVNPIPVISVNSGSICSGNSFLMLPTGAFTYTFSSGSANVSPLSNAIYTVTGTSAQGCVASNAALCTVTVFATPTISINNGVVCSGNSFTLSPSGAVNYTFVNGNNVVSPQINTSYIVIGASAQGCTNSAISNVTVNNTPVISVNNGQICSGKSFTIQPTGASSYTFSGGSAVVSPGATTTYSIVGMSNQGCVGSNTAICIVTVNQTPTISVNNATICLGQAHNLNPNGAFTYTYSGGSPVVSPTVNSSYQITGTSALGCAASNTVVCNITVNPLPVVNIVSSAGTSSPCAGESITLTANGALNYLWSSNNGTLSTIFVIPNVNTLYTVAGTAANSCVSTASVLINVSACTGLTSILDENSLNLYPNPVNNIFNLDIIGLKNLQVKLFVTNTLGQTVLSALLTEEHSTFDISQLAKGVYLCRVEANGVTRIVKLVKE